MTYAGFHVRLTLPPLAVLAVAAAPWRWDPLTWGFLALLLAIVVAFTFPWDSHAVARRTWEFDPKGVWRRVGYLPVEEVAFFVIQTLIVVAAVEVVRRLGVAWLGGPWPTGREAWSLLVVGGPVLGVTWLVVGLAGRRIGPRSRWHYAWHLLYWFLPVIAAQWLVGPHLLGPRWPMIVVPALVVGAYLCWADLVAVRAGLWFFDEAQVTGVRWRGVLPWEEVAFFFLTSILVAQSWVLFRP